MRTMTIRCNIFFSFDTHCVGDILQYSYNAGQLNDVLVYPLLISTKVADYEIATRIDIPGRVVHRHRFCPSNPYSGII